MGWLGHGNLGDESIFEAQRTYFGVPFLRYPTFRPDEAATWSRRLRSLPLPETLLLGGGTVVGRPEWLERVLHHRQLVASQRLVVWGAGVEDPGFAPGREFASNDSLEAWSSVLRHAAHVGVRGPRSKALLAQFGVDSEIVGDPALRLIIKKIQPVEAGSVLMNVAKPEAAYVSDPGNLINVASEVASQLIRSGHSVTLFAMHETDLSALSIVSANEPRARVLPLASSVQHLLTQLSSADVVVSQRLHGNVLAAALGRPFVSLDYRPKCQDFAESVEMAAFNVRVDSIHTEGVLERVRMLSSGDFDSQRYLRAVNDLRKVLPPALVRS